MTEEEKSIQQELSLLVLLADRLIKSAKKAESSKSDYTDLTKQTDLLSLKPRFTIRLTTTTTTTTTTTAQLSLYEHLVFRIVADVSKTLERALTLVHKCKHSSVLQQVFAITTNANFCNVSGLLESSIADVSRLISIANNNIILAMLWSSIAFVQIECLIHDCLNAANNLVSLS